MVTLTNQPANKPLSDSSTRQPSDILKPESLQQSQDNSGSLEDKDNEVLQSLFPDARFLSIVNIAGGLVIGVALAFGHHVFLEHINGRNINEIPQVWIKRVNNGFSNIFSIFVGLSAGTALTQLKWGASGTQPLRVYTIDNLFALPAPLALLKTLVRPRRSLFSPILSSVLIQALFLVSVLAPSALIVDSSKQKSREMEVPIFNLESQSQFAVWRFDSSVSSLGAIDLSPLGQETINSALLNLSAFTWSIPQACGLNCAFNFTYNAPALECHDVLPGGSQDPLDRFYIYDANTTLYPPPDLAASPNRQIDVDAPYDLSITYTSTNHNQTNYRSAGTYCRFYRATYKAFFDLDSNSGTQRAGVSIITHGGHLSWGKTSDLTASSNEQQEGFASWAICYAFAWAFRGGPFEIAQTPIISRSNPVLASIFKMDSSTGSFELAVDNLSRSLVDRFSNLTLALMLIPGGKDSVTAELWDGSGIWLYTAWTLLAVYLPALILAVAVALYGLRTIQLSGIAMDDKFSTFLLVNQNRKLDGIYGEAADFEELQRFQLILSIRRRERFTSSIPA